MLTVQKPAPETRQPEELTIIEESPPRSPKHDRPSYGSMNAFELQHRVIKVRASDLNATDTCCACCECFIMLFDLVNRCIE